MGNIILCNKSSEKGFTLVETLVSIVVISILAVSFFQLIGWNYSAIFLVREKTKATAAAQEKLDILTIEILQVIVDNESVIEKVATSEGYRTSEEDLYIYSGEDTVFNCEKISHSVGDNEVNGYQIIVVNFYAQGKHHVRLDYFIEG